MPTVALFLALFVLWIFDVTLQKQTTYSAFNEKVLACFQYFEVS